MKKIILLMIFASNICYAQTKSSVAHSSTTIGAQGRYEIVQSTLVAKLFFRLDRTCGFISQLVLTPKQELTWETMQIIDVPKCSNDGKIHYQLFTSGLAARNTFLINNDTGKTWQIQTFKDDQNNETEKWVPLLESF